ncbi:biotin/lipoyl-binding protein [Rhodoferax sp. 4810]|uniref:Biotin/lipoyl-binding protein n=1 Tax=Thiospirillum jenense TaxID=1653858 RepID=A0A839HBF6_9GAMM|nr:HlyD family efflux transporter periplasmic adaptor subunit [Thiospirillum jenense]MBB1073191.1 biotin/lipoyl-binding protein [Rhodoferax jenense]MBB1124648.1 biotin/lipoyl-binding protein [Thiospirillum jenense]
MATSQVWRRRGLPIIIMLIGIAGFIILKATRPVPQTVTAHERIWRVQVIPAAPAAHHPVLALFGRVEAPDQVRLTMPVTARLQTVRVRDGQRVKANAVLAQLDSRDLEPRLQRAQADVDKEQLNYQHDAAALVQERELLRLAEVGVTRAQAVQNKNLASISSVDTAREQLARARLAVTLRQQSIDAHPARLAALEATLAEAQRDFDRGTLRAPFAARIASVTAAAGEQLPINQTVMTLYPLDGLYLRAKLPGCHCDELRQALANGVELTAQGQIGGRAITAVLERIAGEADARGVDALLKLTAPAAVPIGAVVDMRLQRPLVDNSLALPFSALHGGDRIFTVDNGRLRGVTIERIGERGGDGDQPVEVLVRAAQLPPNAPIMVTHLPNAIDGLRVEIAP